ncbi:zinc-dependent alcohol dehydrogenase [Micromonospora globbae]|jgi:threonine dehydrogenase-like Zn-dependent dehydrogenase|uniref:Glutathione-dependent formaldehyde dehydrogenase n=1 Tax=Micromonospora globbae TaxID=1894969 RepID=A0A420F7D7_9ACTN|nr:zinc-dependent alcohol dehydrogenase [Micromonospora globbae]RKF28843.1 glutathione-dependent formaldehyde dehydrogenase [Micromonospora globbae]WTF83820.1 glutathione-dependent formaldehyde dehydrogenase [Micromonospora globbae]
MKATAWMGKDKVKVIDVPEPSIMNPRDAIVRITTTAICGSDLHLYHGYIPAMRKGDILGHEFMGEVVEVGPQVRNLRPGDRVVVPFPIACGHCNSCQRGLFSVCENSNPNAGVAEKIMGHSPAGIFGYSHLLGGYAGGQAEYARVPFADVGPVKVPDEVPDDQAVMLADVLPTGYMGAEMCDIKPGHVVAIWGAGPVGLLAAASARLLGAERVFVIDRYPYRLRLAREHVGAETINYEDTDVLDALNELTAGRGPDACVDAVGLEGHHGNAAIYAYDRAKQAVRAETERPFALRQAILACRSGGVVSVVGAYGGMVDKFPMGAFMNRSLIMRAGQCHVQRYTRPLLERIQRGEIDPSFIVSHRMPLKDAPKGYKIFQKKQDECSKVLLSV